MAHRLYVVPGSHPCAAAEAALRLKEVPYGRVDLLPVVHVVHQALVFGHRTVPALRLESGEKVQGSIPILRRLDELRPEPPLLPADPQARAPVLRSEEWGEEVLQPLVRRVVWSALRRRPDALASYAEGAQLPVPVRAAMLTAPLVTRAEGALNRVSDARVRADLRALPRHLDRVDGWVDGGVLGGGSPNAADLQIGAGLALLATLEDLHPTLEGRPGRALARRLFPGFPGRTPAGALPAGGLPASA